MSWVIGTSWFSNEETFGGLRDSFRMRTTHKKTEPWLETWKFQPYPQPPGRGEGLKLLSCTRRGLYSIVLLLVHIPSSSPPQGAPDFLLRSPKALAWGGGQKSGLCEGWSQSVSGSSCTRYPQLFRLRGLGCWLPCTHWQCLGSCQAPGDWACPFASSSRKHHKADG